MNQYYHLDETTGYVKSLLDNKIVRQVLLTGQPGTGKTEFSRFYAEQNHYPYIYSLMHSWITSEELFNALDVAAIATGQVTSRNDAFVPGVLRLAAEASLKGPVVLCLDEIDKVPQKIENALLDFLQTGRVPLADHSQMQANPEKLIIFLTSNGQRKISDALLRRLYRVELNFLPSNVEADIIRHNTGAPMPVIKMVVKLAALMRSDENASKPSLQEMVLAVKCVMTATSINQIKKSILGTIVKDPATDLEALNKSGNWASTLNGLIAHNN